MTVPLRKWGNSIALRIPKDIAQTLSIDDHSMMELHIENGTLIISPQKDDLLEKLLS